MSSGTMDAQELGIASALEADLLIKNGLVLPDWCGCTLRVVTVYPGKPWFWVCLYCCHTQGELVVDYNGKLVTSNEHILKKYDWFTIDGARIPVEELRDEWDRQWDASGAVTASLNTCGINRYGGVYMHDTSTGVTIYAEPERCERFRRSATRARASGS